MRAKIIEKQNKKSGNVLNTPYYRIPVQSYTLFELKMNQAELRPQSLKNNMGHRL